MNNIYNNLQKLYSVKRTLKFELIPIGKTLKNIEKEGIIKKDEHRAQTYQKVKKYCDEYHKYFIENVLINTKLKKLSKYESLFKIENKTEQDREAFSEIETNLRKQISNSFRGNKDYENLFSKNMINLYLREMYKNDEEKLNEISEFSKFTTYFRGFNSNRENMYSPEKLSTAISYRLINENLPIFISNIKIYNKAIKKMPELSKVVSEDLKQYLHVNTLDEIFKIQYFNETLTQAQIDLYNLFISGIAEENNKKIKGLNEYINEYNQTHNEKIPKFKKLYKQILSDANILSFAFDKIEDDKQLATIIQEYYKQLIPIINNKKDNLIYLLSNIDKYDLDKIYLNNDLSLKQISKEIFGDWSYIQKNLDEKYDFQYDGKTKVNTKKYIEERKKYFKNKKVLSIQYIQECIEEKNNSIINYIIKYNDTNNVTNNIVNNYKSSKRILEKKYGENTKNLIKDEHAISKVKELLDSVKQLQNFCRLLIPNDKTIEKDELFYNIYEENYEILSNIIPLYNKVRNYLTQKPYSTDKIKINFENPNLLSGWDVNKEKDNLGVLLRKNNKYYLGLINPKSKRIFEEGIDFDKSENNYEKINYKYLPGPNKMLPKGFFSKSTIEEFNPSKELIQKYKQGYHKKGEKFDIEFCHELIDFFKKSINKHKDWKNFEFVFSNTKEYKDISEFYREVEKQAYKIRYKEYSDEYINSLVDSGKLHLFQIYNKDFSKYSKGKKNLHTMYWEALFNEENLKHIVYKLDGQAEIFFRKASLKRENTTIHNANELINNKNKAINQNKPTSQFSYDIIKNRRYTLDKFYFHAPITLNYINKNINNINEIVNENIKANKSINIIGVDRGERNLLYVVVIDSNENIIYQKSLNGIINEYNGKKYKTDYHELLDSRETSREKARKEWKTIENIKELKEGYMSQVIHQIVSLMIKYNAVIVLEDLNAGFKNSRIKVEKQVYQKFEKMLIEKLNYVISKERKINENGGLLNAYQLTNKFETFQKIGKQTGTLFYIPAWCTSKIDPTTGFMNLFYIKNEGQTKSKQIINKIDDIKYNKKENYFEFYIDYDKFTNKLHNSKRYWTICTNGERIKTFRNPNKNNEWDSKIVNLSESFKILLDKYNIDYSNIKESILKIDDSKFFNAMQEKDGFEGFMNLFKLTVQLRNSIPNSKEDYLISPIKNNDGIFFDSRKSKNSLPKDADANGAYNIARKGLMLINQIKETEKDKLKRVKYNIKNEEWLKFVQKDIKDGR